EQSDAMHDYDTIARLIPDDMLDRLAFAGTPEEVSAQVHALIEAGVDRIEFGTPHGLSEESGLRLLGGHVMGAFRSRNKHLEHSSEGGGLVLLVANGAPPSYNPLYQNSRDW